MAAGVHRRAEFNDVIFGTNSQVLDSATVNIYDTGTTTKISESIFADATGATTLSNPLTSDSAGRIQFYLDRPQIVDLEVSKSGFTTFTVEDVSVQRPGTYAATFTVAANDASAASKATADFVCSGSADDVDIQAAIGALPSGGGSVILSEGTFTITTKIVLADDVTLAGQGFSTIITQPNSTNLATILDIDGESRVTIRDLKIDANGANQGGSSGFCISADGSSAAIVDLVIENCHLDDTRRAGISMNTVDKFHIRGNRITNTGTSGVGNGSGIHADGAITNGVISDNIFETSLGTDTHGIALFNASSRAANSGVTISNNVIKDQSEDGIEWGTSLSGNKPVLITCVGNTIINPGKDGIRITRCTGCIVANNTIDSAAEDGIAVDGTTDGAQGNIVQGNAIRNTEFSAIRILHCQDTIVDGNTCLASAIDAGAAGAILMRGSTCANTTVSNNNVVTTSNSNDGIIENDSANTSYIHDNRLRSISGTDIVIVGASSRVYNNHLWPITSSANASAIPVAQSTMISITTASGNETRTLAAPSFIGQELTLYLKTNGGTDCTVTCSSTVNEAGNNTILFNATGESLFIRGVEEGSNFRWRCVVADGATLSTV